MDEKINTAKDNSGEVNDILKELEEIINKKDRRLRSEDKDIDFKRRSAADSIPFDSDKAWEKFEKEYLAPMEAKKRKKKIINVFLKGSVLFILCAGLLSGFAILFTLREKTETTTEINGKEYIGEGIYLFDENGKTGALNKKGEITVPPEYYRAADIATFAADDVFVLSDSKNIFENRKNTYYIFNSKGRLLKTLSYGSEEMEADGHSGSNMRVTYACGSDLVFEEYSGDLITTVFPDTDSYIKRLVSEKTTAENYYDIIAYPEGEFHAKDRNTDEDCILDFEGNLK